MKRVVLAMICVPMLSGCAALVYSAAEHNTLQECRQIPNSSDRIACEREAIDREQDAREAVRRDD